MDDLRRALVRMVVDQQRPEELPGLAARALAEGLDSPALRELAGLSRNDPRQARDLFAVAMEQLGVEAPASRWDAARLWASEIVDGTLAPYEGARLIWWHCWEELGRPDELTPFVGLASECEDDPGRRRLYENYIVVEARRLVRGG